MKNFARFTGISTGPIQNGLNKYKNTTEKPFLVSVAMKNITKLELETLEKALLNLHELSRVRNSDVGIEQQKLMEDLNSTFSSLNVSPNPSKFLPTITTHYVELDSSQNKDIPKKRDGEFESGQDIRVRR